ncbi:MAG: DoxX family protein [Bacteroidales bacterium]|jgi:uncharacterized membrane protein YphA (DoxX/SURF4 family)
MPRTISGKKTFTALLALLRILIGWQFLYEGLVKLFDPSWTSRPFLEGSRWIFGDLFRWMASGSTGIHIIDFLNAWGLTLVGLALILGLFTRLASWAGVLMISLYYLAYPPFGGYNYGAANEGSYLIVNKNLIELVCLIVLAFTRSGQSYGIDSLRRKKKVTEEIHEIKQSEQEDSFINKRRQLLKGLAGLPFLAGFTAAFIRELTRPSADAISGATLPSVTYKHVSDVIGEIPKGKLGNIEMTRLIMGCNLISGYAHARDLLYANTLFKAYNSNQKILETFHLAEMAGINAAFLTNNNYPIFNKYLKLYGGKMNSICQTYLREEDFYGDIDRAIGNGATALYIQGGEGDRYIRDGKIKKLASAIEYIKKKGYQAGIGGHSIEVVTACEKEGIPADYYVKTHHNDNYWSAHPESQRVEWSVDYKRYDDHDKIHDNMFDLFHAKTTGVMKDIKKPWIAFKVLAGGAIKPEDGFRFAFEDGADFICVGMFDFQIVDDINTAILVLKNLNNRQRAWYS